MHKWALQLKLQAINNALLIINWFPTTKRDTSVMFARFEEELEH